LTRGTWSLGGAPAVAFAHEEMPTRQSIVNGSIASAIRGDFGDVHVSERTRSSELFINPLMTLYFGFDLAAVADRSLYLPMLKWAIRMTVRIAIVIAQPLPSPCPRTTTFCTRRSMWRRQPSKIQTSFSLSSRRRSAEPRPVWRTAATA